MQPILWARGSAAPGETQDASAVIDEKLVLRRIREGDQCAFQELLDHYETRIYRLALRYADSPADAEDITQEIFLGVFRNLPGFRGASSLSTWIYRVAVNHCLEYRRKRRLDQVPLEESLGLADSDWRGDPVKAAAKSALSAQLDRALARLSPIHRDVIVLHELQGLTYQECAEVLGLPVGTVKSRLSNAFARLRELLGAALCEEMA